MLAMMVSIRETLPCLNTSACFPHRRGGNWRFHRLCYLLFTVLTEIIAITIIVWKCNAIFCNHSCAPRCELWDVLTQRQSGRSACRSLTGLILDFGEGNGSDLHPG